MKISSILRTMLPLMLAVLAGAVLFWTSRGVQHSQDQLADLRDAVSYEREAIRVLQAEWSYLNNPARLDALVKKHFDMDVPKPSEMIQNIDVLPEPIVPIIPVRKPAFYRDASLRPSSPQSDDVHKASSISPAAGSKSENLPASSSQKDKGFLTLIDEISNEGRVDE